MHILSKALCFPDASKASADGLLAIGGDLSLERLKLAYKNGIFPWYNNDEPILWWHPPRRMVLFFNELNISKSTRNIINQNKFSVTYNVAFKEVILNCKTIKRNGQIGTWITQDIVNAYLKLHEQGIAKSVEVWQNGELVGGLYGVDLGHIFCGESMFSKVSNASKIAFIHLSKKLQQENYFLLDCQLHNPYLESLGCREINRKLFLEFLHKKPILW